MSIRKNLIAYLALFIALGGTSYAATQLPAHSVGTRQLRNGAVTDAKVRRGSLTANAFAPGVLPRMPGTTIAFKGIGPPACPPNTDCGARSAGATSTVVATCPSGEEVVGGGYWIDPASDPPGVEVVTRSYPASSNTWTVVFELTQNGQVPTGNAYAVCLGSGT